MIIKNCEKNLSASLFPTSHSIEICSWISKSVNSVIFFVVHVQSEFEGLVVLCRWLLYLSNVFKGSESNVNFLKASVRR